MGKFDKQLKYSIRKVSVGAASVVIGAFYLAMGAGVVHAETNTTTDGGASHSSPSPDPETSRPNSLTSSNYGAVAAQNPGVSGKSTELTTPKEKENNETLNAAQPTEASTSANTRGRRVRRDTGDAPADGTSNTTTGTETPAGPSTGNNESLNSALTERKGATVQTDQPGINIPKGDEPGADDPNAHLSYNDPGHTVTVEEMWKIIQNMPDDFQNNERSYLRNMDTLGRDLRFDKTEANPEGVPLQPGEIREISSFGGWTAIMKKDGETGKFAIGMKNEQGYFTGWYNKNGERQEGGMLGSNALDQIYLHEQALDRRFKYMLMLAKGRTIANKEDKAQDGSTFNIVTANSAENKANLASLPVKDREDILQHAPNIEGFNGIEKTFTAFSTAYGSRLKIEFVTGYISDFEGSKGTYRIVVKAIKKDKSEETVYDHTINRIDGVVENEERYAQGVDLSKVNGLIKKILKDEFDKKVNTLADAKYKEKYPSERRKDKEKLEALKEEAKQELVKKGDVIYELPIDKDKLREGTGKLKNKFKEELKIQAGYATVANDLNNQLKRMKDAEVQKASPTWLKTSELNSEGERKDKDPDRVYKLLDFILPTAKKIIYHADTDQLELQTDPEKVTKHREELKNRLAAKEAELNTANEEKKIELKKEISALKSAIGSTNAYTYTEARNGSKEAKILGSHMEATTKPDTSVLSDADYERYRTNELAANESDGLSRFTRAFVEKNNVTRNNVLPDADLSARITTEIGGDENKLGKGGYFSTGDIPLGKDVVSYKIQVFAENEKRVGVNMQSPRLQYNLPILADFSVIQDTVEPSKELARRIISKSNLPEDKKKEIIEKINKSKKTSEIKSQLSGDVKVKYQDVSGNVLTLDNTKEHQKETDLGKKGEDGTYLAVDSGLRYTNYNVTDKKLNTITTSDGKQYILKRSLEDGTLDNGRLKTSAAETGTLSDSLATVTFVYEEYTPPATGKGVVHFKKQVTDTTEALTGYDDITLSGNVGETFSSTEVDTKITELKNAGYEIVSDTFTNGDKTIDSVTDTDGQDPSQVYNVIVREKVVDVPTPPTPNDPVDPNIPDGPKWPAEGLKESDLTKEVTRTITYVKKETPDGEKIADAQPTKVDKVLYKRTATYNLVSKTVTYSGWTATADDTHTATSFSPVKTPVLAGYVADFKEVTDAPAAPNANGEVTNMTREVVYTKLGSWVPKIPGKTPTPIPYPNDPDDATKPKYPDYPKTPENPDGTPVNPGGSTPGGETPGTPGGGNETPGGETPGTPEKPKTPELPVIPYEPGYTPKIGEKPLEPVDPKDPKKGYKVPEIPKKPGEDTPITYEADPQKALVKVVKVDGTTETPLTEYNVPIAGKTGEEIPTGTVTAKITELEKRGYIVDNKQDVLTAIGENPFDKDKDTDGEDPTQTFTLKVHEKLVPVTPPTEDKPITPGKPIDPDVPVDPNTPVDPKTPVWTEDLINKVKNAKTTKEVTRTINYVDESGTKLPYTDNGKEITESKTDKVTFTREAKINVVTGEITYGEWTAKDNDTTFEAVTSPVVKGYILKANQDSQGNLVSTDGTRVAASTNLTADSENQNLNVVYTKLGSWVLTPPTGVTPPEGTNFDPKPYPNNPTDPTRPGTPVYPEPGTPVEPNTPVIPYVPGYTPKTPDGNPLVPVDPHNPESGYKVPPVPTTPGNDTPITYEADTQKAIVKYVVEGTTTVLHTEELTGDSGTTINYTTANKLAELKVLGYELVTDGFTTATDKNFDKDKTVDQTFEVTVKPKVVDVPPFEPTNPKGDDNPKPEPGQPIDPENPNGPKWTKELIDKLVTTKHVTRTITYVEDGTDKEVANKATDKVTFTRSLKVNVVTGDVVDPNVAWTSNDTTFDEVTSPVVKGYILKANQDAQNGLVSTDGTRVVASENLTATSENQNLNVVYTKLGSWVPTPPAGVTPPTGTNFDPKPYPNHPTDPTKPGEPEYPQPGTPVEPNTPVIPYVPGYTPKTPNGNPLEPVDPNHPENGYKVPPVPTTTGEDTPITYEGNPQKALVKVVKVDGTTETPLPKDNVTINGKTGDQIPTESVTAKIAELEKRGYVIDNRDEVVNYINNKFDKEKDTEGQDPTQNTTLKVHEKLVPVTPPTPEKPLEPGQPIDPDTPVDPNNPNDPTIPRWTDELIKKLDVKKEVTRTINYVDEAGNKVSEPSTDKVTFTREAKINVVTGEITYGDWKAVGGDTTFDKVSSPVVKGYILKDPAQKEVAERKGITPTVANQTIEVVYKKLGSWVPKVPGVEIPTPLPYPNHPTDPTKPGDPTDPTTPNVPVIPYVPGYTPKTPDGNPLVPVDPNHPENGYKVPPVPTKPGEDTPIEYVKVPNTPSPEEPVKPTPESNHITIWVDENGKPLKPEKPGTHEPGNIPGYRYITTVTKDGVTIHKFEKITPVDPNNPVPQKPTTPIPTPQDPTIPTPESQIPTPNTPEANTPTSETNRREELPNTGTEANAGLASAGIMTLLAGLGLGFFKKKEDEK